MIVPLLAHGNLGYWDEVVFVSVALIFLGMMVVSWWRSRQMDADLGQAPSAPPVSPAQAPLQPQEGRFELD
ncbi:MAG: hypothetical protein NZ750_09485 [Anaerolineae bacterium]|nr:hypothetical protein [Anaerolineae bacterium]MDW8171852.1 hypothetical protein [Anaerolineae bacterium]